MRSSATPEFKTMSLPLWPEALIRLSQELPESEQARARFWVILNMALQQRLRIERTRTGPITEDDLLDLAADKSLDLMTRLDRDKWDLRTTSADKVTAFVTTVARNGLVDHLRKTDRRATDMEEDMDDVKHDASALGHRIADPGVDAERDELVRAIVSCASKLKPMHRNIWLFRVFLDMSSKSIANHPEINFSIGNIDVTLQRCRETVRECVQKSGYDISEMPPGTFTALWRSFRMHELAPPSTNQSEP